MKVLLRINMNTTSNKEKYFLQLLYQNESMSNYLRHRRAEEEGTWAFNEQKCQIGRASGISPSTIIYPPLVRH